MEPRARHTNQTQKVTRRCIDGAFLLAPDDPLVAWTVKYFLGFYLQRHGVAFHGAVAMADHVHLSVTDVEVVIGDFKRDLFSMLAKAINSIRGRMGTVWEPGVAPSDVECTTYTDALRQTEYVVTNPPRAGLVAEHREYPGFVTHVGPRLYDRQIVPRPPIPFFGARTKFPETVELRVVPPPSAPSAEAFRDDLTRAVRERESVERETRLSAREAARARGVRVSNRGLFLGAAACRRVPWTTFAKERQKRSRDRINPMFCGPKEQVAAKVAERREFVQAYREAFEAFRAGRRDVVFPAGTFAMRLRHGVEVARAPT